MRTQIQYRSFERILIIKPSHIGDVVHAVPVLAKLRARYPAAQIDWFITPENADLVRCHPALSDDGVVFLRVDLERRVPDQQRGIAFLQHLL